MRIHIVLFALGAWLMQRQAELPDMRCAWVLLVALPALALARSPHRVVQRGAGILMAALWLAGGFFWAAGAAHIRLSDALPAEWEGRDIDVVGVVASLPQPYERSVRFELDVEHVLTPDARVPERIVLSLGGADRRSTAAAACRR